MLAVHLGQEAGQRLAFQVQRIQAAARNQRGTQVGHQVDKVAVMRCPGDLGMELNIRLNRVNAGVQRLAEGVVGLTNRVQLTRRTTHRRHRCRLHLQAHAELQHREHFQKRAQMLQPRQAELFAACTAEHESANAMLGLDQAVGLQL